MEHAIDDNVFGGDKSKSSLLGPKERRDLLYDSSSRLRSVQGISGLLSRRIEYVQHNVNSVLSLLDAAEHKKADSQTTSEFSSPGESLPFTEILEELDEDGKVTSSTITHPGESANGVLEALKRSEVQYSDDKTNSVDTDSIKALSSTESQNSNDESRDKDGWTTDSPQSDAGSRKRKRPRTKKRVSFAEGTKAEHDPSEHPINLPKEDRICHLQNACSQLRQRLGRNIAAKQMEDFGGIIPSTPMPEPSDTAMASQILRLQQNREAKRLLKAYDLDLQGAAMVLCKMAEISDYDLESSKIAREVAQVRDARSTASSSRESSPGSLWKSHIISEADRSVPIRRQDPDTKMSGSEGQSPATNDRPGALHQESSITSPNGDTAEEAALRRQMLQYNMAEVGAVVAELDLDDNTNEEPDLMDVDGFDMGFDADDDDDDDDNDDGEEEEDEHGRTVRRVVSGDYVAEMQALEKKLKARAIINAGPEDFTNAIVKNQVNGHANPESGNVTEKAKEEDRSAKGVRFADNVDVRELPSPVHLTEMPIIERNQPQDEDSRIASRPKPPSRFKVSRASQKREIQSTGQNDENNTPAGPTSIVPLGSRPIIERDLKGDEYRASEPDELDSAFLQNQVRNQYNVLRNRMISNQGGFLKRDDPEEEAMAEVEPLDGGKKMSRFKAARLGVR